MGQQKLDSSATPTVPSTTRWLYWEGETKLLDEKRADYKPHVFEGNLWLSAAQHLRKGEAEPQACFIRHLGSLHLIERTALHLFPAWLAVMSSEGAPTGRRRANLSPEAEAYLGALGLTVEDLFHHALATLHDPAYLEGERRGAAHELAAHPLPGLARRGTSR